MNISMSIIKLNSSIISSKKFKSVSNGYDPLEVDTVLDTIIEDYELIENSELLSKEEYNALMQKIATLEKDIEVLALELNKEKKKNKEIVSSSYSSLDNYELLKRIGKLETILNKKLHMSKKEIETFDPDDC